MQDEKAITLDTKSLKALSSEARAGILKALDRKRMTVSDLSRELNLAKPTLLEHLTKLESTNLVRKEDEGRKWIYYSLSRKGRSILHPERTRFKILFSFSASMIVLAIVIFAVAWSVRTGAFTTSECTYCGDPLWDTFIPMVAAFLGIFGLIVMIYAFRELNVGKPHRILSPPE